MDASLLCGFWLRVARLPTEWHKRCRAQPTHRISPPHRLLLALATMAAKF